MPIKVDLKIKMDELYDEDPQGEDPIVKAKIDACLKEGVLIANLKPDNTCEGYISK